MLIAMDVAREIVASRQAEGHEAARSTAVRLARRQRRLRNRIQRVDDQLARAMSRDAGSPPRP